MGVTVWPRISFFSIFMYPTTYLNSTIVLAGLMANELTKGSTLSLDFIMLISLSDNFKLPLTLFLYDSTGDPQIHVTMFK